MDTNPKRIRNIAKKIKKDEAFLISNFFEGDNNLKYFTNFAGYGFLVIKRRSYILYVPAMEYETAKKSCFDGIKIKIFKKIEEIIPSEKRIGLSFSYNPISIFAKLKKSKKILFNIDDTISSARQIKSNDEINLIKKACMFGDKILNEIISKFNEFKTEIDIERELKRLVLKYGLELSFDPIVANKTSEVHYKPKNKRLRRGFLLIDFGVKYKGYCSDMTRMFFIGRPTLKELNDFFLVRNVQKEIISMLKSNIPLNLLEEHTKQKLGKDYVHSLGHGVGLNVHEGPRFDKTKLKNGMVLTVEPGIYRNGKYGIRIEDTIAFVKNKPKVLTKFTKDLLFLH